MNDPRKNLSNEPGGAGSGTAEQNQTNSTKTVTVGCKLPGGFLMELGKQEDGSYRSHKLNGINSSIIVGGFGITYGVPADFFAAWKAKMKHYKVIKNGIIFDIPGKDDASLKSITRELKDVRTKLEPISRKNLPKGIATEKQPERNIRPE